MAHEILKKNKLLGLPAYCYLYSKYQLVLTLLRLELLNNLIILTC